MVAHCGISPVGRLVVATKVFHRVGDLPEGLSRAQILRSIDDSLRPSQHGLCRYPANYR
ncbi:hypothetical protein [Escherichia coli]|uniref:hypothetical protein n=1 Tax=Escherichia coli TaxID=562 RepID=UPI0039E092DA